MRNFLFLFFIPFFSFGQIAELKKNTAILCSDTLHGRGYVFSGDSIAVEFIAAEFKKIGLKPLKKNYFQSFYFPVNTFPGKMNVQHNSNALIPGKDFLVDPSSSGFHGSLNPREISFDEAIQQQKLIEIVKEIQTKKKWNAICLNFLNLSKDSLKMVAGLGNELAQIIPVIELVNTKFTWSVDGNQAAFPYIFVQSKVYQKDKPFHVEIEAKLLKNHHARNVYGIIKSKNKKAKTLVFTAHYDHLGRMGKNTYFPGANDNASGVATLIEMARKCMQNPIKNYNIVFIAFAGEEIGLLGSKHYVEHPVFPLEDITFLTNLDIMGSGEEGIVVVNATLFPKPFKELQNINDSLKTLPLVKSRGPAANSDHYWFTEKKVPSFFIYTAGPNKNYHDIDDTYLNLSFAKSQELLLLLYQFANYF